MPTTNLFDERDLQEIKDTGTTLIFSIFNVDHLIDSLAEIGVKPEQIKIIPCPTRGTQIQVVDYENLP